MDPKRLTAIPLFSHLSPEEARRLTAFAIETSAAEGEILMKQGDYSTELIAIEEGSAEVIRDGNKAASLKQGDVIGEMGLIDRAPRNADVIATSPMRLVKLTHWEIRRMSEDTLARIHQVIKERRREGVADPADQGSGSARTDKITAERPAEEVFDFVADLHIESTRGPMLKSALERA